MPRFHAPSSTDNKDIARSLKCTRPAKVISGYLGMKIHIGADVDSGAVHSVITTVADIRS